MYNTGVIYLKNMVTQNWQEREVEAGQPQVFHIHEQDRAMIRDAIVDAMVHAPELVRYNTTQTTPSHIWN